MIVHVLYGLGTLVVLAALWLALGFPTLFCWVWMTFSLGVLWLAARKLKNRPIARFLFVAGAVLNAAAGLSNGLVMTLNGFRMPVEHVADWRGAPEVLSGEGDAESCLCRMIQLIEPQTVPGVDPKDVHWNLPPRPPRPPDGAPTPPTPSAPRPTVRLAFLDDRHPFILCEQATAVSKGDILFALGTPLWLSALPLLILGFLRKRLAGKT